jgi:hypothetical protein
MSIGSSKRREYNSEAMELAKTLLANLASAPSPSVSAASGKATAHKLADAGEEQLFGQWRAAAAGLKDTPESSPSRQQLLDSVAQAFDLDPELPERIWQVKNWPRPFPLVLREEIKQSNIRRARLAADARQSGIRPAGGGPDAYQLAVEQNLVGLAFSGGGIRSATFNLGVLQALAEAKILSAFDYLSTVSGGGYIAAWFA